VKTTRAILIAVLTVILFTAGLYAADYVPGELIVKLEHGVIAWQDFEETPIAQVSIQHPHFSA
jgi:hypothetical protein